jgi:hypothetical protein
MSRSPSPVATGALGTLIASLLVCASIAAAQGDHAREAPRPVDFRQLLADAGISDERLAPFAEWDGALNDVEATTVSQILFRLAQVPRNAPTAASAAVGNLVSLEGTVRSVDRVELPPSAPAELRESGLFACDIAADDGKQVTVLASRVPAAWLKKARRSDLNELVSMRGVRLGGMSDADDRVLLLVDRIAWHPASGVPAGTAWLTSQGFDAALLDDVRQNRSFARPTDGGEAEAFYTALAALAGADASKLVQLARDAVADEAHRRQAIAASAAERQKQLTSELEAVLPARREAIVKELADLRRQIAMSAQVERRAAQGLSSVAPMFNEPADSVGKFFVIEGIARRAVRIVVEPNSQAMLAAGEGAPPLTHYYELDVFPTDGQNNPVICCVARLPEGFPTGDLIREPVRVAGIFLKKWAYARRPEADGAGALPERIAPPLMLAAEPIWLESAPAAPGDRGLWAGLAILAGGAVVALVLWRTARRDRLARQRLARYDDRLDDLLEPK